MKCKLTTPMYDKVYAINIQSPGWSFYIEVYINICVHTYGYYIEDLQLWKLMTKMYAYAWWMLDDKYNLNLKYWPSLTGI